MVQPKIRVDSDKFATLDLLTLINRRRVQQITGNDAVPDSNAEADAGADVTDQGNDTDARARYGGLVLGCAASSSEQLPWAHLTIVNGGDANPVTVTSMSVSPDGTQVAASYEDDVIQLWDAKAGMLITSLDGSQEEGVGRHEAFVWTTVYSPDGKYLASGGEDGRILVWAAQDIPQEDSTIIRRGKVISNMDAHDIDVWKLAFSSDGETIASGSVGGEVKLWNALTGHCKHELSGHLAPVQDVKFTPDGAHLVTSAEEIATIWSVETGAKMVDMRGHANTVWTVAVSHAGDRVMTGSEDGTCRIWDMASGEALVILAEHGGPVWSIGWSEDDKQVLSGSDDGSAMIWDSHTGTLLHTLTPDGDATSVVGVVAWSPLGNAVCTGSSDGAIRLWDSDSGSLLAEWRGHGDKVKGVEFTSDGRNIYSACDDSSIRHWSVTDVMRLY
ncbi:WD40 repeat-like protein [Trametopsis cervina]|nr:WD40 repeat-like protein [Trametopsis cervina]